MIESVREGYLLHYGEPRVVVGADPDLALLAGDYLYALGLERLAALGDLEAIRELSDLISLSAQLHDAAGGVQAANALWLGSVTAIAAGRHTRARAGKVGPSRGRPRRFGCAVAGGSWGGRAGRAWAAGWSGRPRR